MRSLSSKLVNPSAGTTARQKDTPIPRGCGSGAIYLTWGVSLSRGPGESQAGASGSPAAPCNRRRRPGIANKPGAQSHEQCSGQDRLPLIEQVDRFTEDVAGDFLIEGGLRSVLRRLLLRAAPIPSMLSHRDSESIVGS